MATKQSILRRTGSCPTRIVDVPEWGDDSTDGKILVRGMTIREFEVNQARADDGKATAAVLARCVLQDESGLRMFSDDDISALAELPLAEVTPVSKAIMELSGLGDDPAAPKPANEAVEDAGKGSELTDSGEHVSS